MRLDAWASFRAQQLSSLCTREMIFPVSAPASQICFFLPSTKLCVAVTLRANDFLEAIPCDLYKLLHIAEVTVGLWQMGAEESRGNHVTDKRITLINHRYFISSFSQWPISMGDGFAVPFHRKQEGCMPHHKRLYF